MDAPAFITRATAPLHSALPPPSVLCVFISGDGDPRRNVRGLFITLKMCCRKKTMSPVDRAHAAWVGQ